MPGIKTGEGIFRRIKNQAVLVNGEQFNTGFEDLIRVPEPLVRQFKLVNGASVCGPVRQSGKHLTLASVQTIGGREPGIFVNRKPYTQLTALAPEHRFNLSLCGDKSMRIVDLIAPIARGTRGLIVSPPRAGKTMLLEQIAHAIHIDDPKARIIMLLIDERPEEVTHFRRNVKAEVFASSNDRDVKQHVELTEFTMAHVTAELECGQHVVVLMDSLTRMARAFNLRGSNQGKGRIMSGGIQAGALEIPRRFFGLARNLEEGGSLTIIATVLVDTGSRMDQLIFEEFKGTGNSELVLDRRVAEARVFPAINVPASGTRKEELLFPPHQHKQVTRLRRALAKVKNSKEAIELLLKFLNKYPTNDDFLNEFVE